MKRAMNISITVLAVTLAPFWVLPAILFLALVEKDKEAIELLWGDRCLFD